jgi:uncharacterized cupredoxin-like copper-binding protein
MKQKQGDDESPAQTHTGTPDPSTQQCQRGDLPDTEEELHADFVYWEDEVEPGESKTWTFTAPAAGEYQIISAIEDHFDAGMTGTLTVDG